MSEAELQNLEEAILPSPPILEPQGESECPNGACTIPSESPSSCPLKRPQDSEESSACESKSNGNHDINPKRQRLEEPEDVDGVQFNDEDSQQKQNPEENEIPEIPDEPEPESQINPEAEVTSEVTEDLNGNIPVPFDTPEVEVSEISEVQIIIEHAQSVDKEEEEILNPEQANDEDEVINPEIDVNREPFLEDDVVVLVDGETPNGEEINTVTETIIQQVNPSGASEVNDFVGESSQEERGKEEVDESGEIPEEPINSESINVGESSQPNDPVETPSDNAVAPQSSTESPKRCGQDQALHVLAATATENANPAEETADAAAQPVN